VQENTSKNKLLENSGIKDRVYIIDIVSNITSITKCFKECIQYEIIVKHSTGNSGANIVPIHTKIMQVSFDARLCS